MANFKEFFPFFGKKKEEIGENTEKEENSEQPVENISNHGTPEAPKQEKYFIAGHDVILRENKLIPEQPKNGDEIKQLIINIANSPKLTVLDGGGQQITGAEFDAWRKEVFAKEEELAKAGQAQVFEASRQNYFSRAQQIGSLLGSLLVKHPRQAGWNISYQEITDGLNPLSYNKLPAEDKEALGNKLNNLILDIYHNL